MDSFGVRGRRRQGEFRDTSRYISDAARRPDDPKGQKHRHLLACGCEDENLFPTLRGPGGAVQFTDERHVHWWRDPGRSGDTPTREGGKGPTRNLASSQVACINFLLPLASIPGALEACLQSFDPAAQGVLPMEYRGLSSRVEFEWIGLGKSLEGGETRGQNNTSADALIVASTSRGPCAYVIEWKYVEKYSRADEKGSGSSGETRRGRYLGRYLCPASSFMGAVDFDDLLWEPFYQLVRLRLLADRMVEEGEFGAAEAKVVVVCPEENTDYRETITSPGLRKALGPGATVETAMRSLLKNPAGFVMTSPENLIAALRREPRTPPLAAWVDYHHERYGW